LCVRLPRAHRHNLLPCPTRRSSDLPLIIQRPFSLGMINVKYGFISSAISCHRLGDISSTAISTVTLDAVTVDILDTLKRWHHALDRKSTRLNSSHVKISYAVFCLKK